MCFLDAAPTIFACFDQPDLKAPYTLHLTTPTDWTVRGNAAATQVEPGRWELATTRPLATYFVSVVAGPYHVLEQEHDGIPLGLSSRLSLAGHLDEQADELFTVTRQCFDAFHRMFGVRYPFGAYHQAFLPEFNAGAMENPGLVTFRDPLVFTSRATRRQHISRAVVVAHEMAHQWFGNLVTLAWWDDLWLNESFAEYMGYRVTAEATEFTDALVEFANVRKIWGLVADGRPSTHPVAGTGAVDAASALQDFDGISYAKGSAALGQLASLVGDDVFLGGVRRHFDQHAFGNATMSDLFTAWEDAGAGDLTPWTSAWLRTSGMDEIRLDRDAGVVRRTPPAGQDVRRNHAIHLARWDGSGWAEESLTIEADETPVDLGQAPVILDPRGETWASIVLDPVSVDALPDLVAGTSDPQFRASVWNALKMGVHHAHLSPAAAAAVLEAGLRVEDQDSALSSLQTWSSKLVAVSADPDSVARRLHDAFRARLATADPASGLALAALRGVIATDDRRRRASPVAGRRHRGRPPARPRPALADGAAAHPARCHRPGRARRPARGGPAGRVTGAPRLVHRRARDGRGQGVGVATLPRRGRRAEPRARGDRPRLLAVRSGRPARAVRRPLLRRDRRHRQGAPGLGARRGGTVVLPADRPRPACGRPRPRHVGGPGPRPHAAPQPGRRDRRARAPDRRARPRRPGGWSG